MKNVYWIRFIAKKFTGREEFNIDGENKGPLVKIKLAASQIRKCYASPTPENLTRGDWLLSLRVELLTASTDY